MHARHRRLKGAQEGSREYVCGGGGGVGGGGREDWRTISMASNTAS